MAADDARDGSEGLEVIDAQTTETDVRVTDYDTDSVKILLDSIILAVQLEQERVRTLEQKCSTLLGFALLITVLLIDVGLRLADDTVWLRVPLGIIAFCLGIGIVALTFGLRLKTYDRPDVTTLLQPDVLTDAEGNVAANLAATWERVEQSTKRPAKEIAAAYNIGSFATVLAVVLLLICFLIMVSMG